MEHALQVVREWFGISASRHADVANYPATVAGVHRRKHRRVLPRRTKLPVKDPIVIPNHLQPYFRRFIARGSDFSAADAAFREIVSLPFYHSLTTREIDRVCAAIAEIGAFSRVTTTTPTPAFRW